ncbi:MAG: hypothetical protein EBZ47_04995 [Chlamydiae bacterium]|nr:hypothetical protein [Chlamydiota bacterium]
MKNLATQLGLFFPCGNALVSKYTNQDRNRSIFSDMKCYFLALRRFLFFSIFLLVKIKIPQ